MKVDFYLPRTSLWNSLYLIILFFNIYFPATEVQAMKENQLLAEYQILENFYNQEGQRGSFTGVNNLRISYWKYRHPQEVGVIVYLPGQAEPTKKYQELYYDLKQKGFSIYALDHRGQGESARLLDNTKKGFVDSYQFYVDDLKTFLLEVVKAETHQTKFNIMAHSMGGGIATLFAIQNPELVNKLALSSPLYDIITKPFPYKVAYHVVKTLTTLGLGDKYATGKSKFNVWGPYQQNPFTSSEERFEYAKFHAQNYPQLQIRGPTNQWVYQIFLMVKELKRNYSHLRTPTLLFSGTDDEIVNIAAHAQAAQKQKNIFIDKIVHARHEIFMEQDHIRDTAISKSIQFFLQPH